MPQQLLRETHFPSLVHSVNSISCREPAGWHCPALHFSIWILSSISFCSSFQRSRLRSVRVGRILCLVPPARSWCLSLGCGCTAVEWRAGSAFLQLSVLLTQRPRQAPAALPTAWLPLRLEDGENQGRGRSPHSELCQS